MTCTRICVDCELDLRRFCVWICVCVIHLDSSVVSLELLTNCDLSLLRGVSDKLSSLDWLLVARLQGPLNHKEGPHLR